MLSDTSLASRLLATATAAFRRDAGSIADLDAAMCIADARKPDMPLIYANNAFLELTGYGREEVIGQNCRFLQGPDTSPEDKALFRAGFQGRAPFKVALLNYCKDGTPFQNQVFVSPMRESDGEISHYFAMQLPLDMGGRSVVAESLRAIDLEVRRLMQSLTSLVSLQARRAKTPEARQALDALMARFEAVAASHGIEDGDTLTDLATYLDELAKRAAAALDPGGKRPLVQSLSPVHVDRTMAAPLGQIAAELLIGAYHAAEAGDAPVRFLMSCDEKTVELRVETGETPPAPQEGGPGHEDDDLDIVAALVRGHGGAFAWAHGPGFAATARIPLT